MSEKRRGGGFLTHTVERLVVDYGNIYLQFGWRRRLCC